MQYPKCRLVVVFTPHPHAKPIPAQGPIPPGAWYQADIAIIDDRLDVDEAVGEEGRDRSIGGG